MTVVDRVTAEEKAVVKAKVDEEVREMEVWAFWWMQVQVLEM